MIAIGQVSIADLPTMLPHIAPHLARGLGKIAFDASALFEDIASGRAVVWAILIDGEARGAFLTSIRVHEDGSRDLDVYGLGGSGIGTWGRSLAERMTEFAKHEGCRRVVFAGRKALARAYGPPVRVIGRKDATTLVYERAI